MLKKYRYDGSRKFRLSKVSTSERSIEKDRKKAEERMLQNFGEIQDLNYAQFINFCEQFSANYNDKVFEQVCRQMKYQKKTISFLRNILAHYHVPNNLNRYLSSLSEYKHPTMEEIYETAHLS